MGILARKKEIGPDTIIQRNNDLLFNSIDGEIVGFSIGKGEYYGINEIGSIIWDYLQEPLTFRNLVHKLLTEFDVPEEKCYKDTESFLQKLLIKELVFIK